MKKILEKYDIQETNIWNMNKTGFRIDCERSRIVIIFDRKIKKKTISNSDNRDYCTTVEVINAVGEIISSLLILKNSNVLFKWSLHNNLSDHVFEAIESEYSNNDLALD